MPNNNNNIDDNNNNNNDNINNNNNNNNKPLLMGCKNTSTTVLVCHKATKGKQLIGTGNIDRHVTFWIAATYVPSMRWSILKYWYLWHLKLNLINIWEVLNKTNHATLLVPWINKEHIPQCLTRLGLKS